MTATLRSGVADPATVPGDRLPIADRRQVTAEVLHALRGRKKLLALLIVILIAANAAGLVMPAALGGIVDAIDGRLGATRIWLLGLIMVGSGIVGAALTGVGVVLSARLIESVLATLRERMVTRALLLPQSVVERAGTGDLISRASDDVARVAEAVPRVTPALTGALFTIVLTFVGMAVLDLRYALALLVIIPVHVLAVRWYLRAAPPVYAAERAAMADRAHQVLAGLRGLDTVLAYRMSERHGGRIAAASWQVVGWAMKARVLQNRFFGRLNFAEFLGMTGILLVGFWLINNDLGTIGAATTAMLFFLRLFDPINQLLIVVDDLQSALASLGRIVGVIQAPTAAAEPDARIAEPEPRDSSAAVRIRELGFAYHQDHPVLAGIELELGRSERVALVGSSGAGKSTLAALIAGVHQPGTGSIDRHADPIVLITQEVHVFAGTLRDNLTLVDSGATDEQLWAALRTVGAEELVTRLPDGLDTEVGGHGRALTAAEVQHLGLARLVLLDPPVAILDEATAEAGSTSAGLLDRATEQAIAGRAALIVAHRLSQAATADRVIVLEHGRIVEQGSHDQLLAAAGRYAELWQAWSQPRT
ncbi:ABC transporter ATP-binding protein [Microlunatus speluncae]|uniref:ABC transporter ATP-binding protein n=1 Tax=Microlunatus speluncae TaxID=2594267 RepID=UPI0012662F23|nr:ABC transporter ATP-binding protein [Microlunatus speluncae]